MPTKQALILIHGIGEQKPMETLRKFVDAIWTKNTSIHNQFAGSNVWSKPDSVSKSFELRRLTTPRNQAGIRTDFFEFYWAHLMKGTTLGHVLGWARSLLLRKPSTVPGQLKLVYWVIIGTFIVSLGLALYAVSSQWNDKQPLIPAWLSAVMSMVLLPASGLILRSVVGDAARYLNAAPTNVQRRHEIRQAGIELIKELHKRGYDRIIVVGHSLGSVIGYDILTHVWVDFHTDPPETGSAVAALDELEALAIAIDTNPDKSSEDIQAAQRKYFNEITRNGNRWRVTDFVTLGSPLAHAAVLMAEDAGDLRRKQMDRELPTCLPTLEKRTRDGSEEKHFSFEFEPHKRGGYRIPHHAAVFAPTRWTNLYFPSRLILWGDLIGGPLQKVFGPAIRDLPVSTNKRWGLFSHTLYWIHPGAEDAAGHVQQLREALDLVDGRHG